MKHEKSEELKKYIIFFLICCFCLKKVSTTNIFVSSIFENLFTIKKKNKQKTKIDFLFTSYDVL